MNGNLQPQNYRAITLKCCVTCVSYRSNYGTTEWAQCERDPNIAKGDVRDYHHICDYWQTSG